MKITNKGAAWNMILGLVLAALITVSIFVGLGYIDTIKAYIFQQIQQTTFTEAVKCSYYSCVYDCDTAVNMVNNNIFDCDGYCNSVPDEFKESGKICGYNSLAYPVEIEIIEDPNIYSRSVGMLDFNCIVPIETSEILDYITTLPHTPTSDIDDRYTPAMLVEEKLIEFDEDEMEECSPFNSMASPAFQYKSPKYFEIEKDYFYIQSGEGSVAKDIDILPLPFMGDIGAVLSYVVVTEDHWYTELDPEEEKIVELNTFQWTRIKISDYSDVLIKPRFRMPEVLDQTLDIICPGSDKPDEFIIPHTELVDCEKGWKVCNDQLSIKCSDVGNPKNNVFIFGNLFKKVTHKITFDIAEGSGILRIYNVGSWTRPRYVTKATSPLVVEFEQGDTMKVLALPLEGYKFNQWCNGDACCTIGDDECDNPLERKISDDGYLSAKFEPISGD